MDGLDTQSIQFACYAAEHVSWDGTAGKHCLFFFLGTSLRGVQGLAAKTRRCLPPSKFPKVNPAASKVEKTKCLASLHNSSDMSHCFSSASMFLDSWRELYKKSNAAKVLKLWVLLCRRMKDCLIFPQYCQKLFSSVYPVCLDGKVCAS